MFYKHFPEIEGLLKVVKRQKSEPQLGLSNNETDKNSGLHNVTLTCQGLAHKMKNLNIGKVGLPSLPKQLDIRH